MRSANARSTAPPRSTSAPSGPRGSSSSASGTPSAASSSRSRSAGASRAVALEHRAGVVAAEPAEHELGEAAQAGRHRLAVAARQQQPDRLGAEPAGDEHERVDARAVDPLEVVDEAQQRLLLGGLRQHAEHARRREEAVARAVGRDAERRLQRAALGVRQPLEQRRQGPQQLVHAGERELRLRLDPFGAQHAEVRRRRRARVEQRGLASARDAADDQHPAGAGARGGKQLLERVELGPAADQSRLRCHRRAPSSLTALDGQRQSSGGRHHAGGVRRR